MELYLVYDDGGDDRAVAGVYTTRQLAERACDLEAYSYQNIVPTELDWLPEWKEAMLPWQVELDYAGEVVVRDDMGYFGQGRPRVSRSPCHWYQPPYWEASYKYVVFTVLAKDAAEAEAKAKAMRADLIASGEYTEDRKVWFDRYTAPSPADEKSI